MEKIDENTFGIIMMTFENEDDWKILCSISSIYRNLCRKYEKEWYTIHTIITKDVDEFENKRETKTIGNRKWESVWYKNSDNLKHKEEYKNNEKNGKWEGWHEDGSKIYEEEYKDGKKEGKWTAWYQGGNKRYEGKYKDDKEEGLWEWWWINGNRKERGAYKNGEKDGKWEGWHEDGTPQYEKEYENGNLVQRMPISPRKKSKKEISQKKCAAQGKMQNKVTGGCRRKCKIGKEKIGPQGKCIKR